MTTPRRFEADLPALLADLYLAGTPDYRDDLVRQTARARQRPAWTFPERWLPVELVTSRVPTTRMPWRQLGVLALIALLLAAMLAVYIGTHTPHVPPPFGPAANGLIPYSQNGDIYLGDLATGSSRLVLGVPEYDAAPMYSPDGTAIAFLRSADTDTDIYAMRPDGSGVRRLNAEPIKELVWAQWAPDSREVAAIIKAYDGDCVCTTNRLEMLDAIGSQPARIVASAQEMSYIQFRPPDGRELLYRAFVDGRWGLFAMAPDGTNQHAIVPPTIPAEMDATFRNAVYSADGSKVFFDAYTLDASAGDPGCCQLYVVNADGSGVHEFVSNTGQAWDGEAAVSPDGNLIAFWHHTDSSTHHVTVIRSDGIGQPIETGPDIPQTAHWVWAPDSSKILMFPDDVASGKAYLLDPAGGPYTTVPWASSGDLDWQRLALPG